MWILLVLAFQSDAIVMNKETRQVRFDAMVQAEQFNSSQSDTHNHHFIVWEKGRSAVNAPLLAIPSDLDIHKALESLGAEPGDNISPKAWTQRFNPKSKAPDQTVEGTEVQVSVLWKGEELFAHDLFMDHGGKGFQFRVGGHAALASLWKSGCVVCLESCPGARVSNATYTMRDLAKENATFALNTSSWPNRGEIVQVVITLKN